MSKHFDGVAEAAMAGAAAEKSPDPEAPGSPPQCPLRAAEPAWHGLDRLSLAAIARNAGGVSPFGIYLDWLDWAMHLAVSPGKQLSLLQAAQLSPEEAAKQSEARHHKPDPRFRHPDWASWPYSAWRAAFQCVENGWDAATQDVRGASPQHQKVMNFIGRQMLDVLSPSNFWFTNPEVMEAIVQTHGLNLLRGARRLRADACDLLSGRAPGTSPENRQVFRVGKEIAATPGAVVYRNALFELIRYAPRTPQTWREPVVIVPSWLLKYYILDLSPHNSLVRYLVDQGHTVFAVSWKNPRDEARDWGLSDYLQDGLITALRQASRECGGSPVHAVGYCLGGTLLSIGAAALSRRREHRPLLRSVTLLAAQTDFEEPGELGLFVSPSGVACLDALMWQQGYLGGKQLAGVFQLLNSRDLIWSRLVRDYLIGRELRISDLMTWNADTTRLPYRMHSQTIHQLYLNNDLAAGRLCVNDVPVALADIRAPMYVVATERDHISPWESVYKFHLLNHRDLMFVLCSGGHNVGIVSEPGRPNHYFRWRLRHRGDRYLPPAEWEPQAEKVDGSWWPHWQAWLARHSSAKGAPPPFPPETALCDAPGTYVFEH